MIVNYELDKKWKEFLIGTKLPSTQDLIPVSDYTKPIIIG
jgi:hypothetical protein